MHTMFYTWSLKGTIVGRVDLIEFVCSTHCSMSRFLESIIVSLSACVHFLFSKAA